MCGALNPKSREVCEKCGARLKPVAAAQPETPPEEAAPAEEGPEVITSVPVFPPEAVPEELLEEEKPEPETTEAVPVFPPEAVPEELLKEEETADWLDSLRAKVKKEVPEETPPEKEEAVEEEELEAAPPKVEIPSWLKKEEPPPVEHHAVPALLGAEDLEKELREAAPEWLREIGEEKEAEEEEEAPPLEEIPPEEAPAPAEIPPWLEAMRPLEEAEITPPEEPEIIEEEIPPEERPIPAEIPPWLEALRPLEEIPTKPERAPEALKGEEEKTGILAGLKGLLKAAAVVGMPRRLIEYRVEAVAPGPERAKLFQEMFYSRPQPLPLKKALPSVRLQPLWPLYLLLIAAVLIPLLFSWPQPPLTSLSAPQGVSSLYEAIERLPPGAPVLISWDYEPSMAGEMDVIAETLLKHLRKRRCKVAAMSLFPTGPALAQQVWERVAGTEYKYGEDFINIGYIPGQEAALRAFGLSPFEAVKEDYVLGRPLAGFPLLKGIKRASDWALIIELAGHPQTLLWWLEQVGSLGGVRLAAGVSAGIEPSVSPYYQSGQLEGLVGGVPGAAYYEELTGAPGGAAGNATAVASAQSLAILVALLIILLGNLFKGE